MIYFHHIERTVRSKVVYIEEPLEQVARRDKLSGRHVVASDYLQSVMDAYSELPGNFERPDKYPGIRDGACTQGRIRPLNYLSTRYFILSEKECRTPRRSAVSVRNVDLLARPRRLSRTKCPLKPGNQSRETKPPPGRVNLVSGFVVRRNITTTAASGKLNSISLFLHEKATSLLPRVVSRYSDIRHTGEVGGKPGGRISHKFNLCIYCVKRKMYLLGHCWYFV